MFIWYRTMSGDASPPTFSISSVMVSSLLVFEQVIVRVRMSFSAKIRAWRILALIQIFSSSMSQDTRSAGMKPGVVIVNTSRGALVDTEALIEGLRSRKIGAACLDVYEEEAELFYEDRSEAIIEDDTLVLLIAMPNVIVSSHQAFLTKEALNNIAAVTVDNLLKFGRGEPSPDTEVCAPKEQDQRRS